MSFFSASGVTWMPLVRVTIAKGVFRFRHSSRISREDTFGHSPRLLPFGSRRRQLDLVTESHLVPGGPGSISPLAHPFPRRVPHAVEQLHQSRILHQPQQLRRPQRAAPIGVGAEKAVVQDQAITLEDVVRDVIGSCQRDGSCRRCRCRSSRPAGRGRASTSTLHAAG